MSSSSSTTARAAPVGLQPVDPDKSSKIPVTPAVLRAIFASSRTPHEERSISRIAFFRFAGFILSCFGISFLASRANGAGLLGVA